MFFTSPAGVARAPAVFVALPPIDTGSVAVSAGRLHYESRGTGPVVVLIHGTLTDTRLWDAQFQELSGQFRVIRLDLRGHGRSSRISGPFSYHQDLYEFLRGLGLPRASLVGFSLGGRIGLDFTLSHPEMVDRLVLVSAGLSGYQPEQDTVWLSKFVAALRARDSTRAIDLWLEGEGVRVAMSDARAAPRMRAMTATNWRYWLQDFAAEQPLEPPALGRLSEIRTPALVVGGGQESLDGRRLAELLKSGIRGAQHHEFPAADHMVPLLYPGELASLIARFLNGESDPPVGFGVHDSAARASYRDQNFPEYRRHIGALGRRLPASPRLLYLRAGSEALAGGSAAALGLLSRLGRMGLVYAPQTDQDFASVHSLPAFAPIARRFRVNGRPVGVMDTAFRLPDKDLIPEDIAYDPVDRKFYVSEMRDGQIYSADRRGVVSSFVKPGALGPVSIVALAVDPARRILWATTAHNDVQRVRVPGDSGQSTLVKLSLQDGRILARIAPPPDGRSHFLGDIGIGPGGEVIASDATTGQVYRVGPEEDQLRPVLAPGEVFGPQEPAVSADGTRLLVADYARGIVVKHLGTGTTAVIETPDTLTLAGIDGLALVGRSIFAVQNGTTPARVIRADLSADFSRVEHWEVLLANHPGLVEPTHAVLVGRDLFFIMNSQGGEIRDAARSGHAARLSRPVIGRIRLRGPDFTRF